jgi:hypothetical protein
MPVIDDSDGPEERLADHFLGRPGVERKKAFGRSALTINGKIFVIFRLGEIVVKLPVETGAPLIESGEAGQFEPGPGRYMKEWFTIGPAIDESRWIEFSETAFAYVQELLNKN